MVEDLFYEYELGPNLFFKLEPELIEMLEYEAEGNSSLLKLKSKSSLQHQKRTFKRFFLPLKQLFL